MPVQSMNSEIVVNSVWKTDLARITNLPFKLNSSILQESFGFFTQNIILLLIPQFLFSESSQWCEPTAQKNLSTDKNRFGSVTEPFC